MIHIETLTAEDILEIKRPSKLFGSKDHAKDMFRRLTGLWHPDRNKNSRAEEVMIYINTLFKQSKDVLVLCFEDVKSKRSFRFKYKKRVETDLGEMFIGNERILHRVSKDNKVLFERGVQSLSSIVYPSKMMEDNFKRFIPKNVDTFETEEDYILTFYKNKDQVRLYDIIQQGIYLDENHLSWIITGLFNFSLFMQRSQNKIFCGLDVESVFINNQFKSVHILDGWWFVTPLNGKLSFLPGKRIAQLPSTIINTKKAISSIDPLTIRYVAFNLLGDETGIGSRFIKDPRKELIRFLRSAPKENILDDYADWLKIEKTLQKIPLPISTEDFY